MVIQIDFRKISVQEKERIFNFLLSNGWKLQSEAKSSFALESANEITISSLPTTLCHFYTNNEKPIFPDIAYKIVD